VPDRAPLPNRVTPFGAIVAMAERGTLMGNRGGRIHDAAQAIVRPWASRRWISCELVYGDRRRVVMGVGYTELFFLDEVTALAAGHRPCFFCRRKEAQHFLSLAEPPLSADEADLILHGQRHASRKKRAPPSPQAAIGDLPDGAMVAIDGEPYAVHGCHLLRWTFDGYTDAQPRTSVARATLITPPLFVGILARGYRARWHDSAAQVIVPRLAARAIVP
jgi:hypothetical protein